MMGIPARRSFLNVRGIAGSKPAVSSHREQSNSRTRMSKLRFWLCRYVCGHAGSFSCGRFSFTLPA
jgi:hypothetical protein